MGNFKSQSSKAINMSNEDIVKRINEIDESIKDLKSEKEALQREARKRHIDSVSGKTRSVNFYSVILSQMKIIEKRAEELGMASNMNLMQCLNLAIDSKKDKLPPEWTASKWMAEFADQVAVLLVNEKLRQECAWYPEEKLEIIRVSQAIVLKGTYKNAEGKQVNEAQRVMKEGIRGMDFDKEFKSNHFFTDEELIPYLKDSNQLKGLKDIDKFFKTPVAELTSSQNEDGSR